MARLAHFMTFVFMCLFSTAPGVGAEQAVPEGDGIARVRRETKGRGGKTVTTVSGVLLKADDLKALAKRLKNRCGCGGAVKDGVIEIQGDKAEQVCELLKAEGYQVKRAGG